MTGAGSPAAAHDHDGFAPISGYGVLGDGRGVSLVAEDGAIDWWAASALESTPVLSAILDPAGGGRFTLRPDAPYTLRRRYLSGTNVLETEYETDAGVARVTDSLNVGAAGRLPWTELARRVEGVSGEVTFRLELALGTGLGVWSPWSASGSRRQLHAGPTMVALRVSDDVVLDESGAAATDSALVGRLTTAAQTRALAAVVSSTAEPLFLASPADIDGRIDSTIDSWRAWTGQIKWEGPDRDAVVRSALALKLLIRSGTGAIAAAATTSLPERVGGTKNWDYRFSWIRDASFTVDALLTCGLQEEAHASIAWLLDAVRRDADGPHVFYALNGEVSQDIREAPAAGYRNSGPVRVGNDAIGQRQLGIYGDFFGTIARWVAGGQLLDTATSRQLADLADRCADQWRSPDAGIWELGQRRHYTISKIGCWHALTRAAELSECGAISGDGSRWRSEAARVRDWIEEHCWSQRRLSYTFFAGGDELDAAVLLGARFGYGEPARMASTVDAIESELGAGDGLLYRYTGMREEEECFLACSYWMAEALALTGRPERGRELLGQLADVAVPLGLLSEMVVPSTGELMGNLPQALSHLAHINATRLVQSMSTEEQS